MKTLTQLKQNIQLARILKDTNHWIYRRLHLEQLITDTPWIEVDLKTFFGGPLYIIEGDDDLIEAQREFISSHNEISYQRQGVFHTKFVIADMIMEGPIQDTLIEIESYSLMNINSKGPVFIRVWSRPNLYLN